ncbi:sensor histidine kinase [Flexithrix dorotheae]|uniref:sensor histidine kinase n=1 Tax=Flexithrix dorotheae TaxID=70993 RepID=UPI00037FBBBB|nr:ATP-binding protein [Flexithrix dorotheae]
MFKNRFTGLIVLRVFFLQVTMIGLAIIFGKPELFFNQIILSVLIVIQVIELINFVTRTNKELSKFLSAIHHADFTVNFTNKKLGRSFSALNEAFTEIIKSYTQVKIEREAQFQFLEVIVKNIDIGLISIKNGSEIVLMNDAAEKLLKVPNLKNWSHFKNKSPKFGKEVESIFAGGSKLIEIVVNENIKQFAVNVVPLNIIGDEYELITFKDIKTELERKELEAWNKLIRILTHEIMNSLTPVSSLTETMLMLLEDKDGVQKPTAEINKEIIEDLRFSLKTIQKRSDGMLDFVDDYRKLTKIPAPVKEEVLVKTLFESVGRLMQAELKNKGVNLEIDLKFPLEKISADFKLIEQILINLITNGIHALEREENPKIKLSVAKSGENTILEVADNGKGIEKDKLDKIFIPFYSTRKGGSGIGLSLSKNIMNLHGGALEVYSEKGQGSRFSLVFN